MFDIIDILGKELEEQKRQLKLYENRLRSLPEGNLSVSNSKGKSYYSKYEKGKRTYLGNDENEEVQQLQLRKLLTDMSTRIKDNQVLMCNFLEKYQDPSPYAVEQAVSKAYRSSGKNLFTLYGGRRKDWARQPYQRNTLYPEKMTHKTMRGDFVRSKSEVIIANHYFMKGLQYRCEEVIEVGGRPLSPDFSVLVLRMNKVKYHEHFGMMYDPIYREKAMKKIDTYIANGFRLYEDIIFTFDDLDGNIDTQVLDVLVRSFMM